MYVTPAYAMLSACAPVAEMATNNFKLASAITDMQAAMLFDNPILKGLSASYDVAARSIETFDRRPFDIKTTKIGNRRLLVQENIIANKPFMRAINFQVCGADGQPLERNVPKILLVAPMSGHFATLLRETVKELLPYADVTITDWKNARNIPVSAGRFDLGTYQQYLIDLMQQMGSQTHTIGVCQPTVPLLAAVSQMAATNKPNQPLSMTLMGGPIHPSANITQPVQLAKDNDMSFFEGVTGHVPWQHEGAFRRVYPGFMQLIGFMNMNLGRHINSIPKYFDHLTQGDESSAEKHRVFYDEFRAVMDMPAEFYLETIDKVFKREDLAHGRLILNNHLIDPGCIQNTSLMVIEGGRDDIAGTGQCAAAQGLCTGLADDMKFAHFEEDAGHYAIFSGSKFAGNIAPRIIGHLYKAAQRQGIEYTSQPNIITPDTWNTVQKQNYAATAQNDNNSRQLVA